MYWGIRMVRVIGEGRTRVHLCSENLHLIVGGSFGVGWGWWGWGDSVWSSIQLFSYIVSQHLPSLHLFKMTVEIVIFYGK